MSDDGEDLTMWLHADLTAAKGRKRSATSVALDSLSSMTLDPEVPALRLCPALSNWEANAQLPLNSWLEQTTLHDNSGESLTFLFLIVLNAKKRLALWPMKPLNCSRLD